MGKIEGFRILSILFILKLSPGYSEYTSEELVSMPGHLKKFGTGRPNLEIDSFDGFPTVKNFFNDYVLRSRPLLMKGAAKFSPGFENWKDDNYFLGLQIPADNEIHVETKKKEDRNQKTFMLHFKDFIKTYNATEQYMVDTVPEFLMDDVLVPGPLQCEQVIKNHIADFVMWFSSGGTKSVVHTDSVDNLNCLFQGSKEFVMVDPAKHVDKVYIDHPEGAYSDIDVDRVDYTKYPGLADVEYYNVHMDPGDCLYLPFKWIHGVRSFNRNIAVNVWWDRFRNKDIDLDKCPDTLDPTLTLSSVELQGFSEMSDNVEAVREHFTSAVKMDGALTYERFLLFSAGDPEKLDDIDPGEGLISALEKAFDFLDQNGDRIVTLRDLERITDKQWIDMKFEIKKYEMLLRALEEKYEEERRAEEGEDYEEEDEYFERDEL